MNHLFFESTSFILRFVLGLFFLFSGYHKLFNPLRRAALAQTFRDDNCYSSLTMWAIPLGEFFGGLALLLGLLSPVACVGLSILCLGATCLDGFRRVRLWQPLDAADAVDDVLYLPEVLYIVLLLILASIGPGTWSVDHLLHIKTLVG